MSYISEPMVRSQLRLLAQKIRKIFQVGNILYIPVITILENVMPVLFEDFSYEYVPKEEFPERKHAETDILNHVIRIREDIYEGAIKGNGRDRMTIMHEISHYILIFLIGVKFERNYDGRKVNPYEDPEWQAKALAGEIMCPHDIIKSLGAEVVAEKCGVSLSAAIYNLKH